MEATGASINGSPFNRWLMRLIVAASLWAYNAAVLGVCSTHAGYGGSADAPLVLIALPFSFKPRGAITNTFEATRCEAGRLLVLSFGTAWTVAEANAGTLNFSWLAQRDTIDGKRT